MKVNVKMLVAQSCPTLCNPMDCSPSGSSLYRILKAKILQWVAISFSRGSFQPRIPGTEEPVATVHGAAMSWTQLIIHMYRKYIYSFKIMRIINISKCTKWEKFNNRLGFAHGGRIYYLVLYYLERPSLSFHQPHHCFNLLV